MAEPIVSVVIPAYNHERFVGPAVQSVLAQSLGDLELIVVDDGSTDSTGDVVQSIRDKRLHYFRQANADAYNALNAGLARARGSYVAILNSDDLFLPNRLSALRSLCEETGAACAFSDVGIIDADGAPIPPGASYWHLWHKANRDKLTACGDLYATFLHGNLMVSTSNLFMRRSAFEKVGPFAPLRYLHDYDFIFRMMLAYPDGVRYAEDQLLLNYRIHGSNTLKEGAVKARREDQQVIRTYLLANLADPTRLRVQTGLDRLQTLAAELDQVQKALRWGRFKPMMDVLYRATRGLFRA
jgi:glycosyltransferase involved in cell wall biosynthesis